jgi:low affinity Fe/Cu permease
MGLGTSAVSFHARGRIQKERSYANSALAAGHSYSYHHPARPSQSLNRMKAGLPISSFGSSHASSPTWFGTLATTIASLSGKPTTFLVATAIVLIWGITGPIFNYSDTWQLVINTGTTIVTFLMVFLIQHTQNRDTLALQLKLDELIIATKAANNAIASIEDEPEEVLEAIKEDVRARAKKL